MEDEKNKFKNQNDQFIYELSKVGEKMAEK